MSSEVASDERKGAADSVFVRPSETLAESLAGVCLETTQGEDGRLHVSKGLLPITFPTGYGKSWAAVAMIAKYHREVSRRGQKTARRFFYTTPQKKNLPTYEEIADAFVREGLGIPAEHDICILKPLDEMLLDGRFAIEDAPAAIKKLEITKKLAKAIDGYARALEIMKRSPSDDGTVDVVQNCRAVLVETANIFSRSIETYLSSPNWQEKLDDEKKGKGKHERSLRPEKPLRPEQQVRRVKTDQNWRWLGRLYPTIFLDEAKVIVCTTAKFCSNVHTVIKQPYILMDSNRVKDSVIIFDELDAIKDDMLGRMAEEAARYPIDLVDTAIKICTRVLGSHPGELFMEGSRERENNGQISNREILGRIKEVADSVFQEDHLDCSVRTDRWMDDGPFIFYSGSIDTDARNLVVEYDPKKNTQTIRKREPGDEGEDNIVPLGTYIGKLEGIINFLTDYLRAMSAQYKDNYDRHNGGESSFTLDSAMCSILGWLLLNREEQQHILDASRSRYRTLPGPDAVKTTSDAVNDKSVFAQGFRYNTLRNSDTHDMSSQLTRVKLHTTPERAMLALASQALVIGLSATAGIESVIGGFADAYLESQQPGLIRSLPPAEEAVIKRRFDLANAGFANIEHRCSTVPECDTASEWVGLLGDIAAGEEAFLTVRPYTEFDRRRLSRLAYAYKYFLENNVDAMLALAMPAPTKDSTRSYSSENLMKLFRLVDASMGRRGLAESLVVFVDSSKTWTDEMEKNLRERLNRGGRAFVVAAYNTLGRGVNLKFVESDPGRSVAVWDDGSGERDYDGIFFDRPTNLFPWYRHMDGKDVLMAVFQVQSLYENDEIGRGKMREGVDRYIRCLFSNNAGGKSYISFKDCPSVKAQGTRFIGQGSGRITRTGRVARTVHILADPGLADAIDSHAMDGQMVNHVFSALIDHLGTPLPKDDVSARAERNIKRTNSYVWERIGECTSKACWSNADMRWWEGSRKAFPAHPTFNKGDSSIPSEQIALLRNSYAEAPWKLSSYTFEEEGDFKSIDVSFDSARRLRREVSAEAAGLDFLATVTDVREAFEENGWPLVWEPGDFIMTPIVFNNIYLGVIGEEVGKHILQKYLAGIVLEPLTEGNVFEVLDFRIAGSDAYVDMKYWRGGARADESAELEKVRRKMERLGATKALICNLAADSADGYRCRILDGGKVMTVPYIIDYATGAVSTSNLLAISSWLEEG